MKAPLLLSLAVLSACGDALVVDVPVRAFEQLGSAASLQLWVFDRLGRDGEPIGCAELLDRTLVPGDPLLVALKDPIDAAVDDPLIVIGGIPPGRSNRTFYVDVFDAPNQLGRRVGAGCVENVTITAGQATDLRLSVEGQR